MNRSNSSAVLQASHSSYKTQSKMGAAPSWNRKGFYARKAVIAFRYYILLRLSCHIVVQYGEPESK